jgi:ArsR family transcriptional regulator, arsenate/arsenite/antimonite-responsive transcriptional repressor
MVDQVDCSVRDCGGIPLVSRPVGAANAEAAARAFKALADPIRVRLLSLIGSHAGGEACVCELTGHFTVSDPTISHHLKVLREAGLVTGERRASWMYYRVVPEALAALAHLLDVTGMEASQPASSEPSMSRLATAR